MDFTVVFTSIAVFLTIIFLLVGMLLGVKARLLPSGPVKLLINGEKDVEVSSGGTLLSTLGDNKIFLPSACGGGGTCIQCKCIIKEGGGEILPTEVPHFSRKEIADGWRLGCQVKVKDDMVIEVPEEVFGIKKFEAKVLRNWNVASFIKEFVNEIPEEMKYEAGGYIQIEIPKCEVDYKNIDIVIHPQSIIHSLIELQDTSVLAQLGWPDMRLPLLYALSWPERIYTDWETLDLVKAGSLTFREPDHDKYPCMQLAYSAGEAGGAMSAVLNAANEQAVALFLEEKIAFLDIPKVIEKTCDDFRDHNPYSPSLEDILEADNWARKTVLIEAEGLGKESKVISVK